MADADRLRAEVARLQVDLDSERAARERLEHLLVTQAREHHRTLISALAVQAEEQTQALEHQRTEHTLATERWSAEHMQVLERQSAARCQPCSTSSARSRGR